MIIGELITEGSPEYLKWVLKDSDKEEIKTLLGREDYSEVLLMSCLMSHKLYRMVIDGETEGIYGIRFMTERRALIWFLSSPKIYQKPLEFLRFSREFIDSLEKGVSYYNAALTKNQRTLRWLRWLGFKTHEVSPEVTYFHLEK